MAIGLKIKHSTGEITTGTGNLTLNAASDLVLDYATFPSSDGTANQILQTDGAGNLSWVTAAGTGTVTSITAGTGLTGGTITTAGTVAVDVGTTASKIVQLDGSARLPAVDGSQLTNISHVPAGYNNSNWDTAYGWGNHASGGYLTSETFTSLVQDTTPQLGGTLDANGNTIDMGTYVITDAKVGNYDTAVATMPNWNTAYVHSQAAHAPSGAEVNQNAFTTVAVSGQSNVVADTTTDTLTLVAGSNVTLTTTPGTDSVTIASSGGGGNSFETIAVSGQGNVVADTATDTLTFVAGTGITLATDAGTDSITINASGGAGSQNVFETISVTGQTDVVADTTTDTLTLVAGSNMTITTSFPDTITFASSGGGGGGSSSFTFTVNYSAGGTSIASISNLPSGWSASISSPNVTITHTANGQPMGVSFYGLDKSASPDVWKYGYPTSTYPVTFPDTGAGEVISTTEFTLNIGTTATGANTGTPFSTSLAHVKVIF